MVFVMTVPFVADDEEALKSCTLAKQRVEVAREFLRPLDFEAMKLCTIAYLPAEVIGTGAKHARPETMGVPNFGFLRKMPRKKIEILLQQIADAIHIPVYVNNADPEELIACFPGPQ